MNLDQLTESLHATADPGLPDLDRILAEGRRHRTRRRLVGVGTGLATVLVVAAPLAVVAQLDRGGETGFAVAPTPTYRLAEPIGQVMQTGSKFYLPPAHSASRGLEAIWAEQDGALHFGWRSEDDRAVHEVGVLARAGDLASGVHVVTVPEQPAEEPTIVVTHPVAPGTRAQDYALGVESDNTAMEIRQRGDVLPGFVVFTFAPLHREGALPDLTFMSLSRPDGSTLGFDLNYTRSGLDWAPAADPS